jgi:hypothetical protein
MAMRDTRAGTDASNVEKPRGGRAAATTAQPGEDQIASLVSYLEGRGVLVLDRRSVLAYLRKHSDLLPVVKRVSDVAVERLGDRCELSIEVYRDPEHGGKRLYLVARQWPNEPGLLDEIDAIMDSSWELPPETTGWFHLKADRQRPRRR